jgi:RNA polymerase sigma-70 factor (ECF subfamily)
MALYTTHRAALIEYAVPLVGDRTRAEDVVQEAFIRFSPQNSAADRELESPLGYLYRIVRNLAYDLRRRRTVEERVIGDDRSWWKAPTEVRTPEEDVGYRQQLDEINQLLADSPQVQQAFNMHRGGGYTLQEIARELGVSVNTAHRLVRQGLARVAMHLASPED